MREDGNLRSADYVLLGELIGQSMVAFGSDKPGVDPDCAIERVFLATELRTVTLSLTFDLADVCGENGDYLHFEVINEPAELTTTTAEARIDYRFRGEEIQSVKVHRATLTRVQGGANPREFEHDAAIELVFESGSLLFIMADLVVPIIEMITLDGTSWLNFPILPSAGHQRSRTPGPGVGSRTKSRPSRSAEPIHQTSPSTRRERFPTGTIGPLSAFFCTLRLRRVPRCLVRLTGCPPHQVDEMPNGHPVITTSGVDNVERLSLGPEFPPSFVSIRPECGTGLRNWDSEDRSPLAKSLANFSNFARSGSISCYRKPLFLRIFHTVRGQEGL